MICKLFANSIPSPRPFSDEGFMNWNHSERIGMHEKSKQHREKNTLSSNIFEQGDCEDNVLRNHIGKMEITTE